MTNFALGDVLSITTGRLVSRDHMDGIYRILNHMTNDNLYTHQLPRAMDECQGPLLSQHPQLAGISTPELSTADEVIAWLDVQEAIYGTELPVAPLAPNQHAVVDPLEEACDLVGAGKVYVATQRNT